MALEATTQATDERQHPAESLPLLPLQSAPFTSPSLASYT